MKIKVTKDILLKELNTAGKFRGKENKNNYIGLHATAEGLKVKSTDTQVYYTNSLPLQIVGEEDLVTVHEVVEEGKVALTSKFEEILRKIPSKQVEINVENNQIEIKAEGVNAKVSTVAYELPEAPTGTEGQAIASPKAFFEYIANKTAFAASNSDSRPVLKGINIKGDGTTFKVVVTDSHRLASIEQAQAINMDEITIPAKVFSTVLETLDSEEKIKLVSIGNYVKLVQEDKEVYILLLDGNYPDTSNLVKIPETASYLKVNGKALSDALDRAVPFSGADKKKQTVQLEVEENQIKVSSAAEDGSINSTVAILNRKGDFKDKIAFNPTYMRDAIKAHNQADVFLVISGKERPAFVLSEEKGNTQLVLPVRV